MFTKKLVEKDVEVTETITKIEKRLVDVYVFEEEEYTDKERLRREINQRMGRIFTNAMDTARIKCGLSKQTTINTLGNDCNLTSRWRCPFDDGEIASRLSSILELSEILTKLEV